MAWLSSGPTTTAPTNATASTNTAVTVATSRHPGGAAGRRSSGGEGPVDPAPGDGDQASGPRALLAMGGLHRGRRAQRVEQVEDLTGRTYVQPGGARLPVAGGGRRPAGGHCMGRQRTTEVTGAAGMTG